MTGIWGPLVPEGRAGRAGTATRFAPNQRWVLGTVLVLWSAGYEPPPDVGMKFVQVSFCFPKKPSV